MHAISTHSGFAPARSIIEERPLRPPIIGKIRPGIKVLTKKARDNPQAVQIHDALLAQGLSFEDIGKEIERKTGLSYALIPRNTPYFTCRGSDFTNPAIAEEILTRYGEDRGDGHKLWRFPVVFAFDDWLRNIPNELAVFNGSGRVFWSQYGPDGLRQCKTYAPVERSERARRAKRIFGGRTIILRQDDAIHDGVCDPQVCPQYQDRQCNLSASFVFAIPDIKGLGLIELPTNSIYVLQKAHAAMQTVVIARGGRLAGTKFWLSKQEVEISRIDDDGLPVRQKQWLTTLDAEIDLGALLDGADHIGAAIDVGTQTVALLEQSSSELASATPTSGEDAGQPTGSSQPSDGSIADQFEYLIVTLGMQEKDTREQLRVYAHSKFGKGWTKREQDMRALIEEMSVALVSPPVFREKVKAEFEASHFSA
ncbi:hypothetical protein [Ralstonia solanacearum]|uniref:recombination directionality factor n=1 Tax=Ralstonia solanacearum TaxID=305 RepID=UPI0005AC5745|nr:hypothetical protein [Ralstonia solanacearum]MDC6177113.1 hypothetical protein [Ralstonia solanacearum]MDC6238355.1 hypothetical protein [Ralstonia solanacearum]